MVSKNRKIALGIILAGMLLAASCGTGESKEPTPDVAAVKTEAAMEVLAQLTVDAVMNPSATPIPATMTPLPTATEAVDATATTKVYSSGGGSSSGGSSGTPIPTSTPDVYVCEVIDEYPLDGPQMTGWIDDKRWTIKNTGLVTWNTTEYYVTWIADAAGAGLSGKSVNFSPKTQYPLKKDVAPGDTVDIIIDYQIPTQPEDDIQVSYWGIMNDNGDLFCKFYWAITLTYPAPTKTPTKSP